MTIETSTPWVQRLAGIARPERPGLLEDLVLGEFRAAMLMPVEEAFPHDESYFALGLTSLGATEIEQRLEETLGRPINATSLLNNPTVATLLTYLQTDVLAEYFPAASSPPDRPRPTSADTGGVTRAMVEDLLADLYAD
jgi:acyl carrier protein